MSLDNVDRKFYTEQGYSIISLEELDTLFGKYYDFLKNHDYSFYYVWHLIQTVPNIKAEFDSLFKEVENAIARESNNQIAKYILALLYRFKDAKKTFELYNEGTNAGYAKSMYRLGLAYCRGNNFCPKDYERAYDLLSKSYALGVYEAKTELGWMYLDGKHVDKSFTKAFDCFKESQNGTKNKHAIYALVYAYLKAPIHGYEQDLDSAERLCLSISDNKDVQYLLGNIYKERNYPPEKIINCYKIAAERIDITSANRLSEIYSGKKYPSAKSAEKERYWAQKSQEWRAIETKYKQAVYGDKPADKTSSVVNRFILIVILIVGFFIFIEVLQVLIDFIFDLPNRIIGWFYGG